MAAGNDMEPIVMTEGDEAWEHVNYEMMASGIAGAIEGLDPSASPPQQHQGTETAEDFMKRTMLREELRVNILQRRFQKGLGNVQLDWKFTKAEKLTPEEEEKRRLRRERNRVAASRCRERRRERTYLLVTETDELESKNSELMREIQQLEAERQELMSILSAHQQTCGCSPPVVTPSMEELHIDP